MPYDQPKTPGTPASGAYGSYDQPGSQQALNDQDGQYYHFSDKEAGAGAGVSLARASYPFQTNATTQFH